MASYILLTRMTAEAMRDLDRFREMNSHVDQRLREEGLEIHWVAHYTTLGPYDYLDIFEAKDNEEAAKVALVIRSMGHATTEVWPAVPWERFDRLSGKTRRKPQEGAA